MKDENFIKVQWTVDLENIIQVHKVDGSSMKDENSTKSIKWMVRP